MRACMGICSTDRLTQYRAIAVSPADDRFAAPSQAATASLKASKIS